jgi:GTP-binding protein
MMRWVTSALEPDSWPRLLDPNGKPLPEIALAGRSNAGKSTFINLLSGRKTLAKVSSTPGKTQRMQFFCFEERLAFVDLPGFGFAKAPLKLQAEWSAGIDRYLNERSSLKALILVLDSRRTPDVNEFDMASWAKSRAIPLLPVFTKIDMLASKFEVTRSVDRAMKLLSPYEPKTPLLAPGPRRQLWGILNKYL